MGLCLRIRSAGKNKNKKNTEGKTKPLKRDVQANTCKCVLTEDLKQFTSLAPQITMHMCILFILIFIVHMKYHASLCIIREDVSSHPLWYY